MKTMNGRNVILENATTQEIKAWLKENDYVMSEIRVRDIKSGYFNARVKRYQDADYFETVKVGKNEYDLYV